MLLQSWVGGFLVFGFLRGGILILIGSSFLYALVTSHEAHKYMLGGYLGSVAVVLFASHEQTSK